jgi:hypothetical protein
MERTRETKVMVLVLADGHGKRRVQSMADRGWGIDAVAPRFLSRASTVVFSRPRPRPLSRRERKLAERQTVD